MLVDGLLHAFLPYGCNLKGPFWFGTEMNPEFSKSQRNLPVSAFKWDAAAERIYIIVSLSVLGGLEENKSVEEAPTVAKCLCHVTSAPTHHPKKISKQPCVESSRSEPSLIIAGTSF